LHSHGGRYRLLEEELPVLAAPAGLGVPVPLDAGDHTVRRHEAGAPQGARVGRDHQHGGDDGEGAEGDQRSDEGSVADGVEKRATGERADQPAHDGQPATQHHSHSHSGAAEDEFVEGAGRGTRESKVDGDTGRWCGGIVENHQAINLDQVSLITRVLRLGGPRAHRPRSARLEIRRRTAGLPDGAAAEGVRRADERELCPVQVAARDRGDSAVQHPEQDPPGGGRVRPQTVRDAACTDAVIADRATVLQTVLLDGLRGYQKTVQHGDRAITLQDTPVTRSVRLHESTQS